MINHIKLSIKLTFNFGDSMLALSDEEDILSKTNIYF